MDQRDLQPGHHLAAYFAARGVQLSPDEAAELLRVLLRLAALGAIVPAPADECRGSAPSAPASAGVSVRERGAAGGSGLARIERGVGLEGPTVYNMGPSDYHGSDS